VRPRWLGEFLPDKSHNTSARLQPGSCPPSKPHIPSAPPGIGTYRLGKPGRPMTLGVAGTCRPGNCYNCWGRCYFLCTCRRGKGGKRSFLLPVRSVRPGTTRRTSSRPPRIVRLDSCCTPWLLRSTAAPLGRARNAWRRAGIGISRGSIGRKPHFPAQSHMCHSCKDHIQLLPLSTCTFLSGIVRKTWPLLQTGACQ
jgi:hypothetical protein